MRTLKAAVFVEPGRIERLEIRIPDVVSTDTSLRITTTTLCGTDAHILLGECPLTQCLNHEQVLVTQRYSRDGVPKVAIKAN